MCKFGILFAALLILISTPLHSEECQLRNRPNDEKVVYLSRVGLDESDPCVSYFIYWLGTEHYEPAVPVLIRFLDFTIKQESSIRAPRTLYPAREALVKIGKVALPSLMTVIASTTGSPSVRSSAVEVWMRIYRDEAPEGVSALKRAASDVGKPEERERLLSAVSEAITRCAPDNQAACKAAGRLEKQ